ncbi:MAG: creatininase family protein [Fimbriimonadaceae bacterium]|nr:creatininase family protein [Fimbriimonadaceae bacterium]
MSTPPREVRWERMFPDELEAAFAACPGVYFPYGLCEPHGPQNTLGLDALKAHAVACLAARRHGGIVAPPDYWHIHELGGYAVWARQHVGEVPRTWLTALPPWQHFKNVAYHVRAAAALGFRAAIFLTGHYGPNWEDLKTLLELLQPHFALRLYGLPDFECNQPGFPGDGASGDHAGKVETSLLWALEPDCVDLSRIPPPGTPGEHFAMGRNAGESDRRAGEAMASAEADWLGAKLHELLASVGEAPPTVLSFAALEDLWQDVVEPVLPTFRTMQPRWTEQTVPPDSRWHPNWTIRRSERV